MYRIRVGSRNIETDSPEAAIELAKELRAELDREKMVEHEKQDEAWKAPMHQPINT